jgi:hypothetical protein
MKYDDTLFQFMIDVYVLCDNACSIHANSHACMKQTHIFNKYLQVIFVQMSCNFEKIMFL